MPITLYADHDWVSPYVFSTFVALEEKALPFGVHLLDLSKQEQKRPEFLGSLTSRVPAIDHDGFWLSESLAIAEYLDEAWPSGTRLFPRDLRQRARARQVMGWLRSDLVGLREDRPTTTMFYAKATTPMSAKGRQAADKLIRVASTLLGDRPTLFDTWSLADAELGFMLQRLVANDEPVPEPIRAYTVAQWSRPSVQKFVAQKRPPLGR